MPADVPDATFLSDYHEYRAEHDPDGHCWTFGDRTWTWGQAWEDIRRFAGALRAEGIDRGDRIAFLDKNNPAILIANQAVCLVGASNAIVNWRLAGDELDYVINDSGARVLFVGHELVPSIELIRDKLTNVDRIIVVGGEADELGAWMAAGEPIDRQPEVTPEDACLVMYSSGTTGRPKGVVLTQHNMVTHTHNAMGDIEFGDGDMMLIAMPMFHVGGSSYALFGPATGTGGYIIAEVDAQLLAGAMMAGATHAFLVPAVVAALLQAGPEAMGLFSRLKAFSYGAAPMPLPILRAALEAWPNTKFMQVYGMTEFGGVVTILDDDAHRDTDHPERLVSAGQPIPGVEVRVVDPATLEDVEPGVAGELWFRTEQSTPGYHGQPEATKELITDDGWVRTGDVGTSRRRGIRVRRGPGQGHDHLRRREHLLTGGRAGARRASVSARARRHRRARRPVGRVGEGRRRVPPGQVRRARRAHRVRPRAARALQGAEVDRRRRGAAPQPVRQDPEA